MAEITAYPLEGHTVRFAAEVKDFDPHVFVDKKEARKMGRFIHFAMAAAHEAMQHSGLQITPENAESIGVHIGSGIGGFDVIEREHINLLNGGPRKISPFFIPASIINLAAGHVSIKYGAKGPNEATATACTSSAHSIGDAFRIIARGDADAMIGDAFHMTGMAPEGDGCRRAMNAALKVAGISPDKIDYVNAHATSTPLGDALESQAIENVFGERAKNHTLLVSSTKSMTGHLLGGAGGLEAGITILAMQHQIAPPTMNLENVDPACRLNYVPNKPQPAKIDYALSNSFGFGGTNGSLVFKRWGAE